jgi:hypothetical protein
MGAAGTSGTATVGAAGTSGTPAAGGAPSTTPRRELECFPITPRCSDGEVSYRPAHVCGEAKYSCELGCRGGEENPDNSPFTYAFYCEETAVRSEGFVCREDIDCVSPEGTEQFFNDDVDREEDTDELLRCDKERLQCVAGETVGVEVGGECYGVAGLEVNPSVSLDQGCDSGACVVQPGERAGVCSRACNEAVACPDGWACESVVDQRYLDWSKTGWSIEGDLPRFRACVPGL